MGYKIKYGLLLNHLFQRKQEHRGCEEPQVISNFFKKTLSSSYQMVYKIFIETSCTNNMYNGIFFVVATFEDLWVVSFQTKYKTCSMLWSLWVFLGFPENRRPNIYCLWEVNLVFYM